MAGPTDLEQLLLEYVNAARLDPVKDAARYVSFGSSLSSPNADVASALRSFGVSGTSLQSTLQGLTPVQPLAWNEGLASAARNHSKAMITAKSAQHQVSGEAALGQRATAAGYSGWSTLNENIQGTAESALHAHAGFMVAWGKGTNGMVSPATYRGNIMSATFREIGIGAVTESTTANPLGPLVVTQDFGTRSASGAFVLGVAYTDRDRDNFYSLGEGRDDLKVTVGSNSVVSSDSGGYQLGVGGSGSRDITLTGGGLDGKVSVLASAGASNIKIDVVNGATLKISSSATVSGAITGVEAIGATGQIITVLGADSHRILGGSGSDKLVGDAGHDLLIGGQGADTLIGGGGNDHLYGQSANGGPDGADYIDGGDGSDYLQGNAGADTLDGGAGNDRLVGGADNDDLRGGAGNDQINGNLGDDLISGGADNDTLRGGQGNDRLLGDAGDDVLMGDLGADTLQGGTGYDRLTGGGDADVFRFAAGDAAFADGLSDIVTDFTNGVDRLALGFNVSAVVTTAAQSSFAAAAATARIILASHADTDVAAIAVGSDTVLFYSGTGRGAMDSAIRLTGVAPTIINTGDFT